MKIESVSIKNFRSIEDQTIFFDNFTAFVGANGSGKSTILNALNVFFSNIFTQSNDPSLPDPQNLKFDDFCFNNTKDPIEITITFSNLSDNAKNDFKHYLRKQEKLIVGIKAEYDSSSQKAPVELVGERTGIFEFMEYFDSDKAKASAVDLKEIYQKIRKNYSELPNVSIKPDMESALHVYERENLEKCSQIPSSELFYGKSKGRDRFEKHLQWVFVPAVKDATTEQIEGRNTALNQLLKRIVLSKEDFNSQIDELRKNTKENYLEILTNHNDLLSKVSKNLSSRLKNWSSSNSQIKLEWKNEEEKSVKIFDPVAGISVSEGAFKEKELFRFGHGLQRSYLLALLQTLAEMNEGSSPRLLLACEEPELYQHPPQIRFLSETFERLSNGNSQIFVATHNPLLISGKSLEAVRLVRKNKDDKTDITKVTFARINDEEKRITGNFYFSEEGQKHRLYQILLPQMNEMFFSRYVVFVEGPEDFAYLATYFKLTKLWSDFCKLGGHIVPVSGKNNLLRSMIISNELKIPCFSIWDLDSHEKDGGINKSNREILKYFEKTLPSEINKEIVGKNYWAWRFEIGIDLIKEIGPDNHLKASESVKKKFNITENKMGKKSLFAGHVLTELWEGGIKSKKLDELCKKIISHASPHET